MSASTTFFFPPGKEPATSFPAAPTRNSIDAFFIRYPNSESRCRRHSAPAVVLARVAVAVAEASRRGHARASYLSSIPPPVLCFCLRRALVTSLQRRATKSSG